MESEKQVRFRPPTRQIKKKKRSMQKHFSNTVFNIDNIGHFVLSSPLMQPLEMVHQLATLFTYKVSTEQEMIPYNTNSKMIPVDQ